MNEEVHEEFEKFLESRGLLSRRLGRSDYSAKAPLHAVIELMCQCDGAIILGHVQREVAFQECRNGDALQEYRYKLPTPWNQIEGALAYSMNIPTLTIRSEGVEGGVFDHGVTGEFVFEFDLSVSDWISSSSFTQPFGEWLSRVKAGSALPK
ncbi:MAG: hypothetical protein ACQETX_16515 [Pseudomonadota bacterium]